MLYTHTILRTHYPLQPLAAFFGGVVAQEVVKFTGKYQPLKQWLHLDCFEVLPTERPGPADTEPRGEEQNGQTLLYDGTMHVFIHAFLLS